MAKFRKKPVVIDAAQWWPGVLIEGVECNPTNHPTDADGHYIRTLEGMMRVSPGDYVITGVNGERYPCKPDIFAKTYEAVDA